MIPKPLIILSAAVGTWCIWRLAANLGGSWLYLPAAVASAGLIACTVVALRQEESRRSRYATGVFWFGLLAAVIYAVVRIGRSS